MQPATRAHCPSHPSKVAVEICSRCGLFVCADCLELDGSETLCSSCYQRSGHSGKASTRAVSSLVLGIVGLNCGFIPGLVALLLATQELAAIDRGESPAAGRNLAKGGRILGYINLALLVIVALVVIVLVAKGL